jgi:hypothetical protein
MDSSGVWLGPTNISNNGGGYPQLNYTKVVQNINNRAAITFHDLSTGDDYLAIDAFPGFGVFNYFDIPDHYHGFSTLWPYLSVDRNDHLHVLMLGFRSGVGSTILYTRSTDDGQTWIDLIQVDSSEIVYYNIVSSPVSDKSAMVYLHDLDDTTIAAKDMYYLQSDDGIIWPWQDGKVNVTEYDLLTDSIYAWSDIDAIYDYNDNLHMMWNAFRIKDNDPDYYSLLYHFDVTGGEITEVARSDSGEGTVWGGHEGTHAPISKMSMGIHEASGRLYVAYSVFDSSDISAAGYGNGEIYVQYRSPDWNIWSEPVNLTLTPSPGCTYGNCQSEVWPCLADRVNDNLNLFYMLDSLGGVAGQFTLYYRGFGHITSVDDGRQMPETISLLRAYPNPFNAQTTIRFAIPESRQVKLTIYDLLGRQVETVLDEYRQAGVHTVTFDATHLSSGVYFYRLQAGYKVETKMMILLK